VRANVKRREFITLIGGAAAAWPLATGAQQSSNEAAIPTIGFLGPGSANGFVALLDGFRQGLGATGFLEGSTVGVVYRWADNQLDRLPALAGELVARRVALIVTGSATAAALAAKAATSTIPIVFAVGVLTTGYGTKRHFAAVRYWR
jgi:putative ABC transport system substrate-binding protein